MQLKVSWIIEKLKNATFRLRYPYVHYQLTSLKVKTIEETIDEIIENKSSLSRFGDGEMMWLLNVSHGSFQSVSDKLSTELNRVLNADSGLMIGLPDGFKSVSQFKYKSGRIWRTELSKYGLSFKKMLNPSKQYYNANISRMYIDYKDYERSAKIFRMLRKIWNNRNILIVEGETSRLGIGNNLFDNSLSIKRIICPSRNAFENYDVILEKTRLIAERLDDPLVLIALGPTATILASDLYDCNFQAIDIGHVDVEYEWFLMHASKKVPLQFKDVSEVRQNHPKVKLLNKEYQEQIVAKIL